MTIAACRRLLPGLFLLLVALHGDERAARQPATLQDLALFSDAVVVAHVGQASPAPAADGGSLALWIDRALKGRLRGEADIVWIPGKELPGAAPGKTQWLLFLSRKADGSWHVQSGSGVNPIKLDGANSAIIAEIAKYTGSSGIAVEPDMSAAADISLWIKKAGKGSQEARREAFAKLLAAGDGARGQLRAATGSAEREIAAVGRTLLPLTGGGPSVNGLRLMLEPPLLEMRPGEKRIVTVHFANLTERDVKLVTGQGAWGDTIEAATAWEVRPFASAQKAGGANPSSLPTVLPQGYGALRSPSPPAGEGTDRIESRVRGALPRIRVAPNMGTLPLMIEIELERVSASGHEQLRLKLPHGHVVIPEAGKYSLRVHFDCPGPRPDQPRLSEAGYWSGGQLVSNDVLLVVK